MRVKYITSALVAATLLLGSCITPKNITYFPDLQQGTTVEASQPLEITVRPEDKLTIMVTTQDLSLSNLFNLVTTQNYVGRNDTSNKVVGTTINASTGQVSYYTVDSNGDINFPVLGKIHIAGLTRQGVAEKITAELVKADLVKDPIVTVEYANTGISVLGSVKAPGRYEFNKDRLTILDAIAMAGDLTMTGVRENILVMRDLGGGRQEAYRVNLLDANQLMTSPVYYVQQDDVIYVEPNDKAKRETTSNGNTFYNPSFWVSLGSVGVTIATLIVTITK